MYASALDIICVKNNAFIFNVHNAILPNVIINYNEIALKAPIFTMHSFYDLSIHFITLFISIIILYCGKFYQK